MWLLFHRIELLDCKSSSKFLLWSAPAYRLRSCSRESSRSFLVFGESKVIRENTSALRAKCRWGYRARW